jgi:hypothetical protein
MSFKYNTSFLELIDSIDWSKSSITPSDLVDYIEALIKKEREEEHKKTWDNIKEIYDTTDYKKHIEEAIKETEQRVLEEVDSLPKYFMTHNEEWIKIEDVNNLREKYKGVE